MDVLFTVTVAAGGQGQPYVQSRTGAGELAMSRRSERKHAARGGAIDYVDGIVKLECPSGHVVGYLWRPDNGASQTILLDAKRRRRPDVDTAGALQFTCTTCRHRGVRLDLQLSAARAEQLLAAAHHDRTRPEADFMLGG